MEELVKNQQMLADNKFLEQQEWEEVQMLQGKVRAWTCRAEEWWDLEMVAINQVTQEMMLAQHFLDQQDPDRTIGVAIEELEGKVLTFWVKIGLTIRALQEILYQTNKEMNSMVQEMILLSTKMAVFSMSTTKTV